MAVAIEAGGGIQAIGSGHANDLVAATDALAKCNRLRTARRVETACEIYRLNATKVSTAADIKAKVSGQPHPLVMWRYSSPTATVHLVGSIHVLKATLYPLPAQIEAAFDAADTIAVEVDTIHADPSKLQRLTLEYVLLPQGQSLASVLPPDQIGRLKNILADQGIPYEAVKGLKPGILATQLAVSRLATLGYLPDFGMENHFLTRSGHKTILELETIEDQLRLLTKPPMSVQAEMMKDTLDQLADVGPLIAEMAGAWFAGDAEELGKLFEVQAGQSRAYRRFVHELLSERNVAMAGHVRTFLDGTGTVFVLVGSAHLAGPDSIVALLDAAGISGHRVMSNESI